MEAIYDKAESILGAAGIDVQIGGIGSLVVLGAVLVVGGYLVLSLLFD